MSIMMTLEADQQLLRAEVLAALAMCNVSEIVEDKDTVTGNFPKSNMYFVFSDVNEDTSIATDDASDMQWKVGSRMVFHYVTSTFDECSSGLHQFLLKLTELSKAHFILSFQYETLYAVRDENGLQIFNKF